MNENIKILYVEDDDEIRNELLEILKLDFSEVLVAANGEEGLALFKKHHPDILISDIQMPKMDGLTMCRKMKDEYPSIPTILTTAFNESDYRKEAERLGVEVFLSKPINIAHLYSAIEDCTTKLDGGRA
jgi:YesN/AraC family two-component response regulator